MPPRLSLTVTTYNRAERLACALASVESLALPPGFAVEVLVIDNNSNDGTAETLRQIAARWRGPEFRTIHEARQGVSHARNRALAEARGEWIAYMDDYQTIDPNYIVELERALSRTRAQCIGGRIRYLSDGPLPEWLPPLIATVGQIDLGDKPFRLRVPEQFLKGGNIAFRRASLAAIGGFDPRLGRSGGSLLAGEEDDAQIRLVQQGGAVEYWPNLIQYNDLPAAKQRKSYWRRHAFGYGCTQVMARPLAGPLPAWQLRALGRAINAWLRARGAQRFEVELEVWEAAGAIAQGLRDPRRRPIANW